MWDGLARRLQVINTDVVPVGYGKDQPGWLQDQVLLQTVAKGTVYLGIHAGCPGKILKSPPFGYKLQ